MLKPKYVFDSRKISPHRPISLFISTDDKKVKGQARMNERLGARVRTNI